MENTGFFNADCWTTVFISDGVIMERPGRMDKSMYKSIMWNIMCDSYPSNADDRTLVAKVYVTDNPIVGSTYSAPDNAKPVIEIHRYANEDDSGAYEIITARNPATGRGVLLRDISLRYR